MKLIFFCWLEACSLVRTLLIVLKLEYFVFLVVTCECLVDVMISLVLLSLPTRNIVKAFARNNKNFLEVQTSEANKMIKHNIPKLCSLPNPFNWFNSIVTCEPTSAVCGKVDVSDYNLNYSWIVCYLLKNAMDSWRFLLRDTARLLSWGTRGVLRILSMHSIQSPLSVSVSAENYTEGEY